jgi:dimethylhistidine N-methyltransferase
MRPRGFARTIERVIDLSPDADRFRAAVLEGLSSTPRWLPTSYLYDETGSQLFEEICELPEYYLTRTELSLMRDHLGEMASAIGPDALVIEPGSGSGIKTRLLMRALERPVAYVPVDVSRSALEAAAPALRAAVPDLTVTPVLADFTEPFELPAPPRKPARSLVYFPGSTIGNFTPDEAVRLLRQLARNASPRKSPSAPLLLVGFDLQKDRSLLEPAYDDARGVTARFNLNLLRRINRELQGDFSLSRFRHRACYDAEHGRIVMMVVSTRAQIVRVGDHSFAFDEGEPIRTEWSYKYTLPGISGLAARAGLGVKTAWTDARGWFAVALLG